ncbi:hypothetical protein [Ruegeria lacuscaerulensis]|uniref:hypothetical protein n=1 Tax=Ruegeria lacuscaerulensis TaxID=55218 RepID=UPI00147D4D10|nr:hypothetical protein [Ruegeria lacuscaerulensis]
MTASLSRGGAAVGKLSDLSPIEASAVLYLRLWGDATARKDIACKIGVDLGTEPEAVAMMTIDRLCALCAHHGRRPLIRHQVGCSCLGADENCFAQMIAAASEGAREDAMMMATLIVRPDFAPALTALSEELGLALRQMTAPQPLPSTGHLSPSAALH